MIYSYYYLSREYCLHSVLVGKPEGRGPQGRTQRRWEDNIKMELKGFGWTGLVWLKIRTSVGLL
jgi:hypothetical protein